MAKPVESHTILDTVFSDPELLSLFEEYLVTSVSVENLHFIKATSEYKVINRDDFERLQKKVTEIANVFFSIDSELEVNVDAHTKNSILERIASQDFDSALFEEAEQEIVSILRWDCWPKFLASPQYQRYRNTAGEKGLKSLKCSRNIELFPKPADSAKILADVSEKLNRLYNEGSKCLDLRSHDLSLIHNQLAWPDCLVHLVLDYCNLDTIPYFQHALIQELHVMGNGISTIPYHISTLKTLKVLNLACNNLTEISVEIGSLYNLTELYLEGNKISVIPPQIGNLSKLRKFNLGQNNVSRIPKEISQCQDLEMLMIDFNPIGSLPQAIGQLKNLQYLSILNTKSPFIIPYPTKDCKNLVEIIHDKVQVFHVPSELRRANSSSKLVDYFEFLQTVHINSMSFERKRHWQADEKALSCTGCNSTFSPLKRRHHCRFDGRLYCARCCNSKAIIPYFGPKRPVRVCNACSEALWRARPDSPVQPKRRTAFT